MPSCDSAPSPLFSPDNELNRRESLNVLHAISLGAVLAALWMLLSGFFEPLMLSFGAASVVLTLWIAHRMDVVDHEGHPIHLGPRAITYFPWLVWQITKANWDIAKVILSPKMPIRPHTFDTAASQLSEVGRTVYANSITLTPGTVTLDTRPDGTFRVHALTNATRKGVEALDMDHRCRDLEGVAPEGAQGNNT